MLLNAALLLSAFALPIAQALSLESRAPSPYNSPSSDWSVLGCVQDQYPTDRVMSGEYLSSASLTPGQCLDYCSSKNFHLAGIENGNQCYCSQELYNGATVGAHGANLTAEDNDGCNVSAAGDASVNGGGMNYLLVFQSTVFAAPTVATVSGATYRGCYEDDTSNRLLPKFAAVSSLTNKNCVTACQTAGFDLAGTENGSQCWCGKSSSVVLPVAEPEKCNLVCPGGKTKYCGGSGYLNVYSFAAATSTSKATSSLKLSTRRSASATTETVISTTTVNAASGTTTSSV